MKISLFSQSLFALGLEEAVSATVEAGYDAIELACVEPHFDHKRALDDPECVSQLIRKAGLDVSALSVFSTFTDAGSVSEQIESARDFIRLAPLFKTRVVKLTPGPPASAEATATDWDHLRGALGSLVSTARDAGVVLAFETHMRQLTDRLETSLQLLQSGPEDVLGLTLDFSNLAFAGDDPVAAIDAAKGRIFNTHVKNGFVDEAGEWHFTALDEGLTDYAAVMRGLDAAGYEGYLTVECLGPEAERDPVGTAKRDLGILKRLMGA